MNLILNDNDNGEVESFRRELERITGIRWAPMGWVANFPRRGKVSELKRYALYFLKPLSLVFKGNVERIAAWQQFYGINYAFWSRLFKRPKTARLVVMTFIYKPKGGRLGRLYDRYVRYALGGGYIDTLTCTSKGECARYAEYFGIPHDRFSFVPWSVNDCLCDYRDVRQGDFVLASGRSNRDYGFLIDALAGTDYRVEIVDDTFRSELTAPNILIHNDVNGDAFYRLLAACRAFVIPIKDAGISAGQTVLLQAWSFKKPVICTCGRGLSDDYIRDGETGLVIEKDAGELRSALGRIWSDDAFAAKLSENGREEFLQNYSREAFARRIGGFFL